jgi:hypothetical protein
MLQQTGAARSRQEQPGADLIVAEGTPQRHGAILAVCLWIKKDYTVIFKREVSAEGT